MQFSSLHAYSVRSLQFGAAKKDPVDKAMDAFINAFKKQGGEPSDIRLRPTRQTGFNLVEVFAFSPDFPSIRATFDAMKLDRVEDVALYNPGAKATYRVNADGVKFIITPDAKGGACVL